MGLREERVKLELLKLPHSYLFACRPGEHRDFGVFTVVDYVAGVSEIGEESPDVKNFISEYVKKMDQKKDKPKNAFQEDDGDAPDNTVSVIYQQFSQHLEFSIQEHIV